MQHESPQQETLTRCRTRRGARRGNHAASRERAGVLPLHAQQPSYNAMPAYMLPQTTTYCAQSVTQPHARMVSSPCMATGEYGVAGGSGMTAAATAAGVFVPPECATPATSATPPMSRRAARAAARAGAVHAAATSATAATRTSAAAAATTSATTAAAAAARPTPSSVDPNNARTWRDVDFHALLRAFALDDGATTLTLPASLTPAQRSFVHRTAAAFKLLHKSAGTGSERALTLTKAVAPAGGPRVGSRRGSSSGSAVAAAAAVRRGGEDYAHNDTTAANTTAPRTMSGAAVGAVAETMAPDVATMSDGERVKTFSGYQGAQLLPCTHLDDATVGQLLRTLQPLHHRMRRGIVVEAHRAPTAPPYHAAALGLAQPPGPSSSTLTAARVSQLQRFRRALPAYNARARIIAAVRRSDVVVVSERVRPEELRRRYARELVLQRHAHTLRRIEEKSVRSMQLLGEDVCAVGDGIVPLYTPLSRRDCGGGGALSTLQRRSSEGSSSSSSSSGGVSAWRALNPVSCAADAAAAACSDDGDDDKATATPWWSTTLTSSASAASQRQRDGSSGEHKDAVCDGSVRIDDSEVAAEAAYSTHASQLASSGWRKTSLRGLCSPDLSIYDDDHDIRICSADVVALEQGRPLPSSLPLSQQLQRPHAVMSLSTRLAAHATNAGNNSSVSDHGTAAADDAAHIDDSRALAMATATAATAAAAQLDTPRFDAGFDDDNSDDEADASDGGSSSATAAVCARAVRSMGASATAQLRQQLCEGSCDGDGEDDDLAVAAYTSDSHAHGMMMGSCGVDDDDDGGGRDDMFS